MEQGKWEQWWKCSPRRHSLPWLMEEIQFYSMFYTKIAEPTAQDGFEGGPTQLCKLA